MRIVDSHTGGEPTRTVVDGSPPLGGGTMAERLDALRAVDHLRTAVTAEPRAPEGAVAAFLTPPASEGAIAGAIFGNRTGYLGMCGHGAIGVVETLAHLGRIDRGAGRLTLDTPAGPIRAERFEDGSVEIENVASRAYRLDVTIDVPGVGEIAGDIAYGGNWFFLIHAASVRARDIADLSQRASRIRDALRTQGVTGEGGAQIDHVEFFGPPERADADAKNFVLCPDGAYDRSPCGTGTSAKMAVLSARGQLRPGQTWRQESIIGSLFTGRIARAEDGAVTPFVRGRAFITGEAFLHFDPADPFRYGIAPTG